jgi:hypothetical protein
MNQSRSRQTDGTWRQLSRASKSECHRHNFPPTARLPSPLTQRCYSAAVERLKAGRLRDRNSGNDAGFQVELHAKVTNPDVVLCSLRVRVVRRNGLSAILQPRRKHPWAAGFGVPRAFRIHSAGTLGWTEESLTVLSLQYALQQPNGHEAAE